MNNAITRMALEASRTRPHMLLLGVMATIGVTLVAPSESASQPRGLELLGATVEDLEEGQGVRLILKTKDQRPIPEEAISFRTLRDVVRVNVRRVRIGRGMPYQTQVEGLETTERVTKAFLYRQGVSSFLRLKLNTSAKEAVEGYRVEPSPEGLVILLPLGGPLPAVQETPEANAANDTNTDEGSANKDSTDTKAPTIDFAPEEDTTDTAAPPKNTTEVTKTTKEDTGDPAVVVTPAPGLPSDKTAEQPPIAVTPTPTEATEEPLSGGNWVALLGMLLIAALVGAAIVLGARSILQSRKPAQQRPANTLPLRQTRILASHPIDKHTEILFMELLGEVMALSKTNGSLQLLYRLGPDATTILYGQVGEQVPPSARRSAIIAARQTNPHMQRSSSSLFRTTPMFETSEEHGLEQGDFGYTLEALSREIHLKSMEENRNTSNSSITELFQPGSNDTISSTNQPGGFAQWLKRAPAEGGVEDSDLFQVMIEPSPQDLSEVPDDSMIDISFVIDESDRKDKERRKQKERVPSVPPPPDIPRKR